ncbi:ead/Ea22-like family protein, partial [Pseudomonas aeruginosa]|nr:ead/Ea22-like family protein [Pseudomonas aeruginosa]
LKAEKEALRKFAAEAYQVLGALDAPENVLNNASDAASGDPLRHETLLPFFAEDYEALRKDAARYRWLRERDLETIR